MKSKNLDHHAKRIAHAIKRNGELYHSRTIGYEVWTARQFRLWRKVDGGQMITVADETVAERLHAAVHRYL
jgi:hypothetical protein